MVMYFSRSASFGRTRETEPMRIPGGNTPSAMPGIRYPAALVDHTAIGPQNAPMTLDVYSDFQCPFCLNGARTLIAAAKAFPKDVRLVFKQFPLDIHSQAALAAEASLAAHAQGKFWEMHDRIFANRSSLTEANLTAWAKEFGLDAARFGAELKSHKYQAAVNAEIREGVEAGVQGTPTVFLNGRLYRGELKMESLKPAIEAELGAAARKR